MLEEYCPIEQRRDDYDSAADAENACCHPNDEADKTKMSPESNVGNLRNTGRSAEFAPPAALAEIRPHAIDNRQHLGRSGHSTA